MKIKRVSDAIVRNFKSRICHISDTHGGFQRLYGKYDLVLHSGDFFPNFPCLSYGDKEGEGEAQLDWLIKKIPTMKQQLQGHPFLFILGNHDFVDPVLMEKTLIDGGINAINLVDKLVMHEGVNYYGFPYIPFISGMWNYEKEIPEMQVEFEKVLNIMNQTYVDVLVCHSAIYKDLDLTYGNEMMGSTVIANGLDYRLNKDMMPTTFLHGHCHESNGVSLRNGMLVSNAACAINIIEV